MPGKFFDILSVSMQHTPAHFMDNSIINTRNVDTLPPTDIAMHSHPFFSIIYVADCSFFTTYINDCELTFRPGNLYILPPGTLHSPKNHYAGFFASANMKFYIANPELEEKLGTVPFYVKKTDEILAVLRDMLEISKLSPSEKASLFPGKMAELIDLTLKEERQEIVIEAPQYDLRFIKVLKYMYANCNRELDLEELASVAHMERTSFAKKFKTLYKITPINYLYSIRLSRSLDLLMSPGLTIAKIAKRVGFKRATAFSTAFFRAFGMSPTEYREILETRKFPETSAEFEI